VPGPAAELRIHGVGGSTGARILGLESENEPMLVAQGGRTFFWKRDSEPHVEGYVWGGLTSDSRLQPLWLLLLPFTLVNAAGWMHEPTPVIKHWRIVGIRMLTFVVGVTLTMTYVAWMASILFVSFGHIWLAQHVGWADPRLRVVIPAVALGALIALVVLLAYRTRGGEKYTTNFIVRGDAKREQFFFTDDDLFDADFFGRAEDSRRLIFWHVLAAGVTTALFVGVALGTATQEHWPLPRVLRTVMVTTAGIQVVLLVVLFVLSFTRRPTGFRYAGPAVTSALGIGIGNATLAGAARIVDTRLGIRSEAAFEFADVFLVGLLVFLALVLFWAVRWHIVPARLSDVADVPHNRAPPGTPANGATSSMQRKTAAFRGLTNGLTRIDIELTLAAFALVGLFVTAALLRRGDGNEHRYQSQFLALTGTKLLGYAGVLLLFVIWTKRSNAKLRKSVGMVWDVLTFWPRRFHPFAVRPYSEQAVPEFQGRILRLRNDHERVLVSAHSQGTVIALAAVAPLVDPHAPNATPITLVTFGSPIAGLYAMAFPAYFNPAVTARVHAGICDWKNYRRLTDPIGSEIWLPVETTVLASPGVTPSPLPDVPATLLERDREPWVMVETHSHYPKEPVMKRDISALRQ
jgi:hypothetical protein